MPPTTALLQTMRQGDRIFELHVLRHIAQDKLQIGNRSCATCRFPAPPAASPLRRWCCRDNRFRCRWASPLGLAFMCREMNRSASSALARWRCDLPGHEAIVLARQDNLDAHFVFELDGKLFRDAQNDIFFRDAADADGAGIFAAMARIQDDFTNAGSAGRRQRRLLVSPCAEPGVFSALAAPSLTTTGSGVCCPGCRSPAIRVGAA